MIFQSYHRLVLPIILLTCSVTLVACGVAEALLEEHEAAWMASAHATENEAFFADVVDERCARCHTTPAYLAIHGASSDTTGVVAEGVPPNAAVQCDVCHSEGTRNVTQAVMPSGAALAELGHNGNCFECHQGRAAGADITKALADMETDEDSVEPELSLPGLHNNPAGPTQYGSQAQGGYEYAGKTYADRYAHVVEFDSCIECHDVHTLQISAEQCSACHLGVRSVDDLSAIRMSAIDYDGDGDTSEGLAGEIETLQERLLVGIRIYALVTEGLEPIEYTDGRFQDASGERYARWTPRLLKAAYNYQYSVLNEGGYAHNGVYLIQLLIDSTDDLGFGRVGSSRPE